MSCYPLKYFDPGFGSPSFFEWLNTLKDRRGAAVIKARVDRLRFGLFGDSKFIEQWVFELRIHYGPGYRVYYTRAGEQVIVLLCAGDKSTQQKDIKKAVQYVKLLQEELHAKNS